MFLFFFTTLEKYFKLKNVLIKGEGMGEMRKYLKIMLANLLVIFVLITGFGNADLEKPVFEKGDYWIYNITLYNYYANGTQYVEGLGTLKTEVVKRDKITINGETHNVVILNNTLRVDYSDGTRETSVVTRYLDENTLAVLKEKEQSTGTWKVTEAIYDPPILYYNYPLSIGKNWTINSTVTFLPDGNTTQYIAFCTCIGKQNITTKAGVFKNCYVVRRVEPSYVSNDTYLSYYFAIHPDTYICFFEEYLTNQTGGNILMSYANLTSYSYSPGKRSEKTPGFEMLVMISSLIIIHVYLRKRR
ncbi:MAG: hypothetical protein DRN16_00660 [Thermoplasmata archaeon]|nr:MAG: hypothetical protein DRN16_00660 [Thermoplasmata archaeon]